MSIKISLTSEYQEFLEKKLNSGEYKTAEEIIVEGLKLLMEKEKNQADNKRVDLTITALSRLTGENVQTLRYWMSQGVIPTLKDLGYKRLRFDISAVKVCKQIKKLRNQGMDLTQIKYSLQKELNNSQ